MPYISLLINLNVVQEKYLDKAETSYIFSGLNPYSTYSIELHSLTTDITGNVQESVSPIQEHTTKSARKYRLICTYLHLNFCIGRNMFGRVSTSNRTFFPVFNVYCK